MGWPQNYGRVILPEIDSTNAEALRRAPEMAGPTWVFAHRQTRGRGRRGRAWADPAGNFAASLLLRPASGPEHAALYSFVASLALFEACSALTGTPQRCSLKWPNDVLLDGGKLAGILLESSATARDGLVLVIGIGVNLAHAPEGGQLEGGALRPVALAAETGLLMPAEAFLGELAQHFASFDRQFQQAGFAPIRTAWLQRAARLGQVITARTMRDSFTGTFETIDETGNLVLHTAQGRQAIAAADVFWEGGY
jgi:BirA family biotin operon repressor/biotin-[acetyl-CoA-carboxylase] ligase